ncbi:MAG: hypothetical protein ABEI06_04640 [Halobacteriaceae archaeon]
MPPSSIPDPFPVLETPFVRQTNDAGDYVLTPSRKGKFNWVFEDAENVRAVEYLDGSTAAVKIANGNVQTAYTPMGEDPMQPVEPYGNRNHHFVTRAIQNTIHRGYFDGYDDGIYYGIVIGPDFGGKQIGTPNPHELANRLFVPFKWARRKLTYETYGEYGTDYDAISDWFREGLFSLFANKFHNEPISEVRDSRYVYGVLFFKPDYETTGLQTAEMKRRGETYTVARNVVQLRRDMFPWFDATETASVIQT